MATQDQRLSVTLLDFPIELISIILEYLDDWDLLSLSETCKGWRRIGESGRNKERIDKAIAQPLPQHIYFKNELFALRKLIVRSWRKPSIATDTATSVALIGHFQELDRQMAFASGRRFLFPRGDLTNSAIPRPINPPFRGEHPSILDDAMEAFVREMFLAQNPSMTLDDLKNKERPTNLERPALKLDGVGLNLDGVQRDSLFRNVASFRILVLLLRQTTFIAYNINVAGERSDLLQNASRCSPVRLKGKWGAWRSHEFWDFLHGFPSWAIKLREGRGWIDGISLVLGDYRTDWERLSKARCLTRDLKTLCLGICLGSDHDADVCIPTFDSPSPLEWPHRLQTLMIYFPGELPYNARIQIDIGPWYRRLRVFGLDERAFPTGDFATLPPHQRRLVGKLPRGIQELVVIQGGGMTDRNKILEFLLSAKSSRRLLKVHIIRLELDGLKPELVHCLENVGVCVRPMQKRARGASGSLSEL